MTHSDLPRRQKTFAPRLAPPAPLRPRRARPARTPVRPVLDPTALRAADEGRALDPEVRRRLEQALARPLSHVRVHTQPADRQLARSMGARAFTYRRHIWLGPHESASDLALIAHEVAHVAQQGWAPRPAPGAQVAASPVGHRAPTLELAARARPGMAPAAVAAPARAPAPARPAAAVQRLDFDPFGAARRAASRVASGVRATGRAVVSGARAVGGAVVEAGEALLSRGRDAVLAVVRRVAPDFLPLFEGDGIAGFVRRLMERGLRSMFEGLVGPLRGILNFGAIGQRVSQAVSWIGAVAGQLARNDCSAVLAAARRVGDFFSSALQPVVDRVREVSDKVSGFFRSIWDAIGAPLMDILRRIGGRIWDSLKAFVRDVGAVIRRVKEALGSAWQTVKRWFGIGAETGEEEGGGLWEWIKGKASSVGESIARVVRPVIGPLRTAAGVLLLIVPGGQIVGLMLLWPRLRQAWNWLSRTWTDLRLVPRARHFLANTVFPALMSAAETVGQALIRAADWLLGLVERVAGALTSALRAATGMLTPLGTLIIGFALRQLQRVVSWARGGLRFASRNMRMLLQRLVAFLGGVLDVLRQLIAIAVNPFGIVGFLAGTLWRLVPECLKGPIIDFILEVIIRVLRALPPLPTLGLLWPLIKAAALGFLDRVKSFAIERKVAVSNKMARIVSGMSPSFAFGYLRGLGLGLWDEITGPFQALATLFELPTLIQNFLSSLGVRLCELIEKIRCFAATLVGRVFGTLDEMLSALGELFGDPGRVIDLIRCAIEGALAGAAAIGASIAGQLMEIFESADDAIGERLGRLTASAVVQAVIAYFTAGVGTAVGIVGRIGSALRTVGRAVNQVLGMLRGLLGRLLSSVRGLASRLARGAAAGGRSVLGRVGGFIRRVAAWFGRLFARVGRGLRRRFGLSPRERLLWGRFRAQLRTALAAHRRQGIAKPALRSLFQRVLGGYRLVAKRPAFITKHGPHFRLWVRKKGLNPLPRRVGRVLQDHTTRWRQAVQAVRRRMRRVRGRDRTVPNLNRILQPLKRQWRFTVLEAHHDSAEYDFDIMGDMSPRRKVTEVPEDFATEDNPLPLRYPKRASSAYPTLYFGPRVGAGGPVLDQDRDLRPAQSSAARKRAIALRLTPEHRRRWEDAGMPIEEYQPHGSKALPLGGRTIGIASQWRISRRKKLKLEPGEGTPGGGRMNRALRAYGFSPDAESMDGDHVTEIQLGGEDVIPNLWPLDASENRSAGSTLASMSFTKPDGGAITMNELKRLTRRREIWFRISGTR